MNEIFAASREPHRIAEIQSEKVCLLLLGDQSSIINRLFINRQVEFVPFDSQYY